MKKKSNPPEKAAGSRATDKGPAESEPVQSSAWVKGDATRAERKALGKLAREKAPLAAHAKLSIPRSGRDMIKVLEESNTGRLPELIPIRYGRMLASPFTFYRGSAALMALDLAHTPVSGFNVQACGDCHIQNFGVYATPERKLVVDINDFDETLPAPWEWDVKRLSASLVLAATASGYTSELGQDAAYRMAQAYREHIAELSTKSSLEVWYSHIQVDAILEMAMADTRRRLQSSIKDAIAKSSAEVLLEKLTVVTNGRIRFKDMPPLLCHMENYKVDQPAIEAFEDYRQSLPEDRRVLLDKFKLVDMARKVVGIGSVGTLCGVALLAGSDNDVLVLQTKEARPSVLEPYAGASKYSHHGQRIVIGQKLMQAASDIFLGWTTGRRNARQHFFVRQLRDVKIGVNTAYWSKSDYKIFPKVAGEILARAHARTGDPAVMRGYIGKNDAFDEAIASYGLEYARQTERDYAQFQKACKSGALKAQVLD
jgi:uncharacterized protein (DUF2252 family)